MYSTGSDRAGRELSVATHAAPCGSCRFQCTRFIQALKIQPTRVLTLCSDRPTIMLQRSVLAFERVWTWRLINIDDYHLQACVLEHVTRCTGRHIQTLLWYGNHSVREGGCTLCRQVQPFWTLTLCRFSFAWVNEQLATTGQSSVLQKKLITANRKEMMGHFKLWVRG